MDVRILVIVACATGFLGCRAAGQALVPKGTLREFVEPPALATASAEHKAMWTDVRKGLLATAAKKPLRILDQTEAGYFIMAHRMNPLMDAYAWSRDEAFVEALIPIVEDLLAQRYVHPTQPDVWSGWWHHRDNLLKYMPIHAAIMYYTPVIKLTAAVRADPKLKAKYGRKVEAWFKDIVEVSIPAWDKRGSWHDLGEKGGYYTHTTHYPDPETHAIVPRKDLYQGSTLAYNKVHTMIESFILLHRMTGSPWYRERIVKCERFFRDHWRIKKDHVEWNYRDFSGPWDFKNGKDGETKTGYFIHPKGGYYASDLEAIVACYDAGIVFTEPDMKLLVKTNLEFMWMGDAKSPKFRKINGSYTARGKYGKGHLWTALARFSPKTRELWKAQLAGDRKKWSWPNAALAYLIATSKPVALRPIHAPEPAKET